MPLVISTPLAVLADAGLHAGAWQQHTDLQRRPLTAHDGERRGGGDDTGGTNAGSEGAARDARAYLIAMRIAAHVFLPIHGLRSPNRRQSYHN
jgi:hypothetical protein